MSMDISGPRRRRFRNKPSIYAVPIWIQPEWSRLICQESAASPIEVSRDLSDQACPYRKCVGRARRAVIDEAIALQVASPACQRGCADAVASGSMSSPSGGTFIGPGFTGSWHFGLTIIFGVMRVGQFCAWQRWSCSGCISDTGPSASGTSRSLLAAAIAAVVMFLFGYLLETLVVKRFVNRPHHYQFIVFIGLSLLFSGVLLVSFGPDPRPTASQLSFQTVAVGPLTLGLGPDPGGPYGRTF